MRTGVGSLPMIAAKAEARKTSAPLPSPYIHNKIHPYIMYIYMV